MNQRLSAKTAWRWALVSIALLFAWAATAAIAGAVPVVVERLEGGAPNLDAARIVAGGESGRFVPEAFAAIVPSREHDVWYRLRLASDWNGGHTPVLRIADPQGLTIDAYLPPAYAQVTRNIYGAGADDGFTRHALIFGLPQTLRADLPLYLHVAPEAAIPRRLTVTDIVDARNTDLTSARLDILFPAIQLATVLVMLSFFLVLRERVYAYFVGQVLFIVLYELYAFGIGYEYLPTSLLTSLGVRACWLMAAVGAALSIEFSRRFLELSRCAPRLDRVLGILRWPLLGIALCSTAPALLPGWWLQDAISIVLLVAAPLLLFAALIVWQQGGRRGGFYLCAWVPGLLLVMVRTLQLIQQWPLPTWLEFALPAAFAFASLVLSFGLADDTLSIRHERDVAHRLAEQDGLTGILNRRAILARLREAFLDARSRNAPLAVLFLDLDHFKRVNDSYGHRAGDQCLRAVITPIVSELRQGDALGRYGGEEFLIVLPGAAMPNAMVVAERIRRRVEEMPMLISGLQIGLTLSVGIAALEPHVWTPEDLIERADAALYLSKTAGRNRVRTHADTVTAGADTSAV